MQAADHAHDDCGHEGCGHDHGHAGCEHDRAHVEHSHANGSEGAFKGSTSDKPELADCIEKHACRAKALFEEHDFKAAARESSRALDILPELAEVSVLKGRALLFEMAGQMEDPQRQWNRMDFQDAYEAFRLALVMDPSNNEAEMELTRLNELLQQLPDGIESSGHEHAHEHEHQRHTAPDPVPAPAIEEADPVLDVIVIGAGAAGIGCAHMLTNVFGLEPGRVLLLERGGAVGSSFLRWPEEMRFISPSFNQQGWTSCFDLNSVAYGTSPAFSLHTQHPSGRQYAAYLAELAEAARLSVKTCTEVAAVEPVETEHPFEPNEAASRFFDVHVRTGWVEGGPTRPETIRCKYVVWAAGEFQYPREAGDACGSLAGTELCTHNSTVRSWAKLPGDDFVIIGGCVPRLTSNRARSSTLHTRCPRTCHSPHSFAAATSAP